MPETDEDVEPDSPDDQYDIDESLSDDVVPDSKRVIEEEPEDDGSAER